MATQLKYFFLLDEEKIIKTKKRTKNEVGFAIFRKEAIETVNKLSTNYEQNFKVEITIGMQKIFHITFYQRNH